ncbi:MAG: 4a-hydroxytetrahydrobiopterin dehydratase [Acidobacteria bacterium]|nr:4a-hydroxytetrahydrobiopterin dehydratase [Acidobacteriota bacterium]
MEFSPAWHVLMDTVHAEFQAPTFAAAAQFVGAIGAAADAADHHPALSLRYPGVVRVSITSHDVRALTGRDERLARKVDDLAVHHGCVPQGSTPQLTTIAIDAMDPDRVAPFWRAVFAYRETEQWLEDPTGDGPPVWFQQMDEPRPQRNRIHLDVYVPVEQAEARVAAALAAGGTLVTDRFAPSWWVLADAEGNEACVCTSTQSPKTTEA